MGEEKGADRALLGDYEVSSHVYLMDSRGNKKSSSTRHQGWGEELRGQNSFCQVPHLEGRLARGSVTHYALNWFVI